MCSFKQMLVVAEVNHDYGDTVPSRPNNIGLQGASTSSNKQNISDNAEQAGEGMHVMPASECYFMRKLFGL